MLTKAVSFELTMTDCLEQSSSIQVDLMGQITNHPLTYRYFEHPGNIPVSLTFVGDSIHLKREAEQLTEIEFNPNINTLFLVSDATTQFGGSVDTLSMASHKDFLFIHYRLCVNEDIISEQKLELKVKEGDA